MNAVVQGTGDPAKEAVQLRFGWPVGTRMQVDIVDEEQRIVNELTSPLSSTGHRSYIMKLEPAGEKLYRVRFFATIADIWQSNEQALNYAKEVMDRLEFSMVVDDGGKIVSFDDPSPVIAMMRVKLEGAYDPSISKKMKEMLGPLMTPVGFEDFMAAEWEWIVTQWTKAKFAVRQWYEFEHDSQPGKDSAFPQPVHYRTKVAIANQAPCAPEAIKPLCVEIHVLTTPVTPNLERIIEQQPFPGNRNGKKYNIKIHRFTTNEHLKIATEPDSLIPHELIQTPPVSGLLSHECRGGSSDPNKPGIVQDDAGTILPGGPQARKGRPRGGAGTIYDHT